MKHFYSFLCLLLPMSILAQITLTQADVPAPGDTIFYARDTTVTEFSIGEAGPNRIWDFSQLQAETNFQLIARDTMMDPDVVNYPGTNLVITAGEVKTFLESTDTAIYILGGGIQEAADFGLEVVRFDPPQKLFTFPTTYGTSFTNFYSADITVDGSLILPGVDSFRVVRRAEVTVEVDGYGTVRTPFNSYSALRQKVETFNIDSVDAYYFGAWNPFLVDSSVILQYQWLASESKGNVVSATVESTSGIMEEIEFFLDIDNASAPTANFIFTDQGAGSFSFEDQSGNAPSTWQWTFGDGAASAEQNPTHTYAEEGDYQVCLTAGNFIGSNQFCQTITVDLVNAVPDPHDRIGLVVQPNPAHQLVIIRPDAFEQTTFAFQLYNGQGQKVRETYFNGQLQLDVSALPAGIYAFFLRSIDRREERWSSGKLQISH